jgi:undecaprenyl diphosphate synthase
LAINYGSKFELINAFKELLKKKKKINENNLSNYLQTKNIPDPDLLIRTGNTKRLSNFLLWQLLIQKFFLKKNYGLILLKMILINYLQVLKKLKETLVIFR